MLAPALLVAQSFTLTSDAWNLYGQAEPLYGSGISAVDFDQDGWEDVVVCSVEDGVLFFRNTGENSFEEVDLGIEVSSPSMASFVDYDNDGDLDLFVSCLEAPNRLFKAAPAGYSDISVEAGISAIEGSWYGHAWGDVNHDGWLDLYVANYVGIGDATGENALFINQGNSTFIEEAALRGADNGQKASFMPTFFDANEDGWIDIYLINDRGIFPNALLLNDGEGTFTDVTFSWNLLEYIDAMSNSVGDPNHDGHHDLFVANDSEGNLLYLYENEQYAEQAAEWGVALNEFCWSGQWADFNNDTWQDLVVSTDSNTVHNSYGRTHVFLNALGESLELLPDSPTEAQGASTFSNAVADFNQDGMLDLVTLSDHPADVRLWLNAFEAQNSLQVELEGTVSNLHGVGARIEVWTENHIQLQTVQAGNGFLAQNPYVRTFGLASDTVAPYVRVTWPSGIIDHFFGLEHTTKHALIEGSGVLPQAVNLGSASLCPGDSTLLALDFSTGLPVFWGEGGMGDSVWVNAGGTYSATLMLPSGEELELNSLEIESLELGDWQVEQISPACFPDSETFLVFTGPDSLAMAELNPEVLEPQLPGAFEFSLTTPSGCFTALEGNATAPAALGMDALLVPPSCFNTTDGWMVPAPFGGTAPITWETDCNLNALGVDTCWFSLLDAQGCTAEIPVNVTGPPALVFNLAITPPSCHDSSDGAIEVAVSGGTGALDWESDCGTENLAAGECLLTLSDETGCSLDSLIEIIAPPALEAELVTGELESDGTGTLTLEVSGGTAPYSISWNDIPGSETYLAEGPETVNWWVTDANDCEQFGSFIITDLNERLGPSEGMYPNPTTGRLTVTGTPGTLWSMHLPDGRFVYQMVLSSESQTIDVNFLPRGMYITSWQNMTGSSTQLLMLE